MRNKKQNKIIVVMGAFLVVASVANALDMVTRSGTTYTDVEVRRVEPDGITIKHSAGLIKIHARDLSDEDRAKYNLTPEAARAYAQQQRQAVFAREQSLRIAKEEEERKQAEEAYEKALQENARTYYLYCINSGKDGVYCSDPYNTYYIIRNYEAMPRTHFKVYAASLGRKRLSDSSSAIELVPVKKPDPKPKGTTVINKPYF